MIYQINPTIVIIKCTQLCKSHDVNFIQELWLFKYELRMSSNISSESVAIQLYKEDHIVE